MRKKSIRKRTPRNIKTMKRKTKRKLKRKSFRKHKIKHKTIVRFESDYQNLRLRYLRAKTKFSKEETKELSYLESLLKSLQKNKLYNYGKTDTKHTK